MGKSQLDKLGKKADKFTKKARKRMSKTSVPFVSRKPTWRSKLGSVSSALAGAAGTYAVAKAARTINDKVVPKIQEGAQALDRAKEMSDKVSEVSDKASSAKTPIGAAAAVAKGLKDSGRAETNSGKKLRHIIREQIDVAVPRRIAYNQW